MTARPSLAAIAAVKGDGASQIEWLPPAVAAHAYAARDEIRTVFISGFPGDVKERELNNILRFLPGYEASQMVSRFMPIEAETGLQNAV